MFIHPPFHREREREPAARGRTASLGGLGGRRQRPMALALAAGLSTGLCFCLIGLLSSSVPAPAPAAPPAAPASSGSVPLRGLASSVAGVGVGAQHQQEEQHGQPRPRYEAQAFKLGDLGESSSRRRRTRIGGKAPTTPANSTGGGGGGWWWERNLARAVLLVVASSARPAYLQRCLDSILAHYPAGPVPFLPIVVSEDGASEGVQQVVDGFRRAFAAARAGMDGVIISHLHHPQRRQQRQQGATTWRQWLLRGSGRLGAAPEEEEDEEEVEEGYHRLARHYAWALDRAFAAHAAPASPLDKVIVLEEDLDLSPDFFAYFGALAPLLDVADNSSDSTRLMAISAWNDNGMDDRVVVVDPSSSGPSRTVHRTDFFPGLGWMLARPVWEELRPTWPAAYWDDWLRQPAQRRGRRFLRPEVSRTHHFGVKGTSNGQFSALLGKNRLGDAPVSAWADEGAVARGLEAVADDGAYDRALAARVEAAEEMEWAALKLHLLLPPPPSPPSPRRPADEVAVRVVYEALEGEGEEAGDGYGYGYAAASASSSSSSSAHPRPAFASVARGLGIFEDLKSGVPRTGYKGVVSTYMPAPLDARVYLVPPDWRARLSSSSAAASSGMAMEGGPFDAALSVAAPL